jgi:hypothetical protein
MFASCSTYSASILYIVLMGGMDATHNHVPFSYVHQMLTVNEYDACSLHEVLIYPMPSLASAQQVAIGTVTHKPAAQSGSFIAHSTHFANKINA